MPSYLAAEVARCQHHHMFISMRARRIMGSNSRVFYIAPLPNSHYTGENGEEWSAILTATCTPLSASDRRAGRRSAGTKHGQQKPAGLKYSTSASPNCAVSERIASCKHPFSNSTRGHCDHHASPICVSPRRSAGTVWKQWSTGTLLASPYSTDYVLTISVPRRHLPRGRLSQPQCRRWSPV